VGVSARDERTTAHRFAIWDSALEIVLDHPLTGVGMNRFRYGPVRDDYPIEKYPQLFAPHAHNEFVQVATDLGLPGLLVYTGWTIVAAAMLWVCWRDGDQQARVVTVAIGGGLLAHTIYGMGDAIPLWDRFCFIYWLMLGLVAAQYYHVRGKV
jgi:O-antigen ligase